MNCVRCNNTVEPERIQLLPLTKVCSSCAKGCEVPKVRGVMCFNHKTGGVMDVISPEAFKDWRRYNPYGKYTGRGSGVHRMFSSSER